MDEREHLRLVQLYSEMGDDEIIDILWEDEAEYRQRPYLAYELLMNEARKRGIDGRLEERRRAEAVPEENHDVNVEFRVVYIGPVIDAGWAKNILEMNGITAFLQDEIVGGMAPHYVSPVLKGAVKVVVDKKNFNEARAILDDYLNGRPDAPFSDIR